MTFGAIVRAFGKAQVLPTLGRVCLTRIAMLLMSLVLGCGASAGDDESPANRDASEPFSISFLSPLEGAVVAGIVDVELELSPLYATEHVALLVEGQVLIAVERGPFRFSWDTTKHEEGPVTLVARGVSVDGEELEVRRDVHVDQSRCADGAFGDCPPYDLQLIEPDPDKVQCGIIRIVIDVRDDRGIERVEFGAPLFRADQTFERPFEGTLIPTIDLVPETMPWDVDVTAFDTSGQSTMERFRVTVGGGIEDCACDEGQEVCAWQCRSELSFVDNDDHCGSCNVPCNQKTERCDGTSCTCAGEYESCNNECVDIGTDGRHCGGCEVQCGAQELCFDGACVDRAPVADGWVRVEPTSRQLEYQSGSISVLQRGEVTLTRPFDIRTQEVTQREWLSAMGRNPSHFLDCPACPVDGISLFDALRFANELSRLEGIESCYELDRCTASERAELRCEGVDVAAPTIFDCTGYRLPTTEEWQLAYLGGASGPFFADARGLRIRDCGQPRDDAARQEYWRATWYCENSDGRTYPVGVKEPNPFGIYDIAGNVAEWTWGTVDLSDRFDEVRPPVLNPTYTIGKWTHVAVHGGAWNSPLWQTAGRHRFAVFPQTTEPWIGMRLARSVQPAD